MILKLNSVKVSYYCKGKAIVIIYINSSKLGLTCFWSRSTRICAKMVLHTYRQLLVPSSGMEQWWASSSGPSKRGSKKRTRLAIYNT
jgi:hypothetical protein